MVFAKNPQAGDAKKRIAATLGNEAAKKIYQKLFTHTLEQSVHPAFFTTHFFIAGEIPDDLPVLPEQIFTQQGEDLGKRMQHAFAQGFGMGYTNCVLIGSDCPQLQVEHLLKAFETLAQHDAVLGPATDGGYYLVGLRRPVPEIFIDIPWSTETVFQTTLARMHTHGISYALLPELRDIDTEEDARFFSYC